MNAITSNTGAHIYSFVNDAVKKYVGQEAAELLLNRQLEGLQLLRYIHTLIKLIHMLIIFYTFSFTS